MGYDDDMPPVDEELRRAMEDVAARQEKCVRFHKLLIFLSAVCFWNVVGVGALFVNVGAATFWDGRLSRKGEALAREAYPWLEGIPFFFDFRYDWGRRGQIPGVSVYERIEREAKKTGDDLTVKLLRFSSRVLLWPFLGMAAYLTALLLFGGLAMKAGLLV